MLKTRYFISSPSVFSTSSYASESRRECIWASPAVGYSSAFNSRNWFFFCIFRKNEEKKLIFIVKCSRDWVTKLRERENGGLVWTVKQICNQVTDDKRQSVNEWDSRASYESWDVNELWVLREEKPKRAERLVILSRSRKFSWRLNVTCTRKNSSYAAVKRNTAEHIW